MSSADKPAAASCFAVALSQNAPWHAPFRKFCSSKYNVLIVIYRTSAAIRIRRFATLAPQPHRSRAAPVHRKLPRTSARRITITAHRAWRDSLRIAGATVIGWPLHASPPPRHATRRRPGISIVVHLAALILIVAAFGIADVCRGSLPNAGERRDLQELAPVVTWVVNTGKAVVIRGSIASAFGLGADDIPVRERGFKPANSPLTEVFAVASSAPNIVFIGRVDEADGSAIVWRTSPSGLLEATVAFDAKTGARRLENSRYADAFAAAKKYFFEIAEHRQNGEPLSGSPMQKPDAQPEGQDLSSQRGRRNRHSPVAGAELRR